MNFAAQEDSILLSPLTTLLSQVDQSMLQNKRTNTTNGNDDNQKKKIKTTITTVTTIVTEDVDSSSEQLVQHSSSLSSTDAQMLLLQIQVLILLASVLEYTHISQQLQKHLQGITSSSPSMSTPSISSQGLPAAVTVFLELSTVLLTILLC